MRNCEVGRWAVVGFGGVLQRVSVCWCDFDFPSRIVCTVEVRINYLDKPRQNAFVYLCNLRALASSVVYHPEIGRRFVTNICPDLTS